MKIFHYSLWPTALFCAFFWIQPVSAASFTVTTTDDEADSSPVCTTGSATDCSLREAVIAANSAGGSNDITVPAGTYTFSRSGSDNTASNGDLDVATGTTLTITGAGSSSTIIDAASIDRVFDIPFSTATLNVNDLKVTGGSVTGDGGGVNVVGTAAFDSVVVTANTATNRGGGLYVDTTGTLTLTDSSVTANTTNSGGGLYNNTGTVTLTRVTVDSNTVTTNGGGIFNDGTLTIDGSTVSNNTASGGSGNSDGGGIRNSRNATATVTDSLFSGNSAQASGGAIRAFCSDLTATNVTFTDNTSDASGGAIATTCSHGSVGESATAKLSHVTVTTNAAANGGGIYTEGDSDDTATTEVISSVFSDNTATSDGNNCKTVTSGVSLGTLTSDGHNIDSGTTCSFSGLGDLSSTDPLLDAAGLADHGGDTQTIGVQAGSPVLDIATCLDVDGGTVSTDQRGYTRPENGSCDSGAYERDQTDPVVTITGSSPVSLECAGTYSDDGATATDNWDGSVSVTTDTSALNEDVVGSYAVAYSANDGDDNEGTASRTVNVSDTTNPVITVTGSTTVTHEAGTTYTDAGATATDACDASLSVDSSSTVNSNVLGDYTVTYTVSDDSGNDAPQQIRTVQVTDTTVPTITVVGESAVTIEEGDTYTDAGATASDSFEGDLTSSISVDNPVDTAVPGEYTVTYSVADSSGNDAAEATRTVTVFADSTDPVITVTGDNPYTVLQGAEYTDEGAAATDNVDGDLTSSISVESTVDSDVAGEYTVTYSVTDTAGNSAAATRTVNVVSRGDVTNVSGDEDGQVIVTYEDGSSQTFTAFSSDTTVTRAVLSTNGDRIAVLRRNGRRLVVLDSVTGEQLDAVRVAKKKQTFTRLKLYNVYNDSKDEIIVLVKKGRNVKVYGITLTSGSVLKNKNKETFEKKAKKLKITKHKKHVRIKKGTHVVQKYRLSRKAQLRPL